MTREEKQKAIGALKISAPIMAVTQEEFNDYIQTLNKVMDWLEQDPVLDKIRHEIEQEYNRLSATRADETLELGECLGLKMSLKILDKYKAESEKA